jgi:hypothetical protein
LIYGAYDLRLKVRKPLTRLLIVYVNERMTCASHFYPVIRHRWRESVKWRKSDWFCWLVSPLCHAPRVCRPKARQPAPLAERSWEAPLELSWAVSWAPWLRSLVVRWTAVIATCAGMAGTSCTTATDALASGHADIVTRPPPWAALFCTLQRQQSGIYGRVTVIA